MDMIDCYTGTGCTVNMTWGGHVCFSFDGYITGNGRCGDLNVGFCQGVNQTAFLLLSNQTGLKGSVCRGRGSKSSVMWPLFILALFVGLSNAAAPQNIEVDHWAYEVNSDANYTGALTDTKECIAAHIDVLRALDAGQTVALCGSQFAMKEHSDKDLGKRESCPARSWTEAQVVGTGTWMQAWQPASNCEFCTDSAAPCDVSVEVSISETVTYSAGFDIGASDLVLGLIKGDAALNFGYSWTQTTEMSTVHGCEAVPGDTVQVWMQLKMGWSDSQVREVTHDCEDGTTYGDWSDTQHADWPMDASNAMNYNSGCSSGAGNTICPK